MPWLLSAIFQGLFVEKMQKSNTRWMGPLLHVVYRYKTIRDKNPNRLHSLWDPVTLRSPEKSVLENSSTNPMQKLANNQSTVDLSILDLLTGHGVLIICPTIQSEYFWKIHFLITFLIRTIICRTQRSIYFIISFIHIFW